MNKIKKFLFGLIIFWFLGFIYVFVVNRPPAGAAKQASGELAAVVEYHDSDKKLDQAIRLNFETLVNKLKDLEKKNEENEALIRNLK
jgi:hypothetical protein